MSTRAPSKREKDILEFMLMNSVLDKNIDIKWLVQNIFCKSMSDGQMGSIKFFKAEDENEKSNFSHTGATAEFFDKDGVKVMIYLNISNTGCPFEMEFWKTDFSPLIEIPLVEDLLLV